MKPKRFVLSALLALLLLALPCASLAGSAADMTGLVTLDHCIPGNIYTLAVLRPGASVSSFSTADILDMLQLAATGKTVAAAWFIPGYAGGPVAAGGVFSDGAASPRLAGTCKVARLPGGLTALDEGAFEGTPLTHIYLPEGLVSIESRAFAACPALTYVSIPRSVSFIADDAFDCSGLVFLGCAEDSEAWQYGKRQGMGLFPVDH